MTERLKILQLQPKCDVRAADLQEAIANNLLVEWPEETLRLHIDKMLSSDISSLLKLAQAIQPDK